MYKLEQKIWDEFGPYIDDVYSDNEGESFGKAYGTPTWWVELKPGCVTRDGEYTTVHESTLSDCYRILKRGIVKEGGQ